MRRLGPLHRDLARVTEAIARRRANLRRLVNRYGLLTTELGKSDRDIMRLVRVSEQRVFGAFADEERQPLGHRGPAARGAAPDTADAGQGRRARPSSCGPRSSRCARRSASSTRPTPPCCPFAARPRRSCETQVRPFARATQPFQRDLGAAREGAGRRRARPDHRLPRAQPHVQHRRLQPGRQRGHLRRLSVERRLLARGARPQRGLPLLAGLARQQHELAVLHLRRARARSGALTCSGSTAASSARS